MNTNTLGSNNVAIGFGAVGFSNTTGSSNTAVGSSTNNGNFSACTILGRDATATADNQFVVGSAAYNAGAVAASVVPQAKVWNVVINGVNEQILLA